MKTFYSLTMFGIVLIASALSASRVQASETAAALPSYTESVKQVEKQLYTGKDAIKVEPQDMAVMTKAAEDLAAQMPDAGLKLGAQAADFSLKNPLGKTVRLSALLKQGPVVLTFYRGAWCPYCNLQMHQLKESLPQFKHYGASIIAITPQTPDKTVAQFNKQGYPFEVLSDLDYAVIKSYHLYWEIPAELDAAYKHAFGLDVASFNGKGRLGLPIPGTFVIDQTGVVRAAFVNTDYKKRMEPADILTALQQLPKESSKK
ncbi:MAG: AhpC/TSA family protein [Gammaproteobacteria bacterium]|nr:AhpC/TSA family protein [Gammaproteobacteria bacterium]